MDEYEYIVERFCPPGSTVYVYGSYAKGSLIRGVSDLDLLVFTEDPLGVLNYLHKLKLPLASAIVLDLRLSLPYTSGPERLHAFLATRYGELICGKRISVNLEEKEIRTLAYYSACSLLQFMIKILSKPGYKERIELLSDALLNIALLKLIARGYYDVTKPELLDYTDELGRIGRIVGSAYRLKYAGVVRIKPEQLLVAAEALVKEF